MPITIITAARLAQLRAERAAMEQALQALRATVAELQTHTPAPGPPLTPCAPTPHVGASGSEPSVP